jgi:hypothetical protein
LIEQNNKVPLRHNQRKGIFYGYHCRYYSVKIQRQAELRAAATSERPQAGAGGITITPKTCQHKA